MCIAFEPFIPSRVISNGYKSVKDCSKLVTRRKSVFYRDAEVARPDITRPDKVAPGQTEVLEYG